MSSLVVNELLCYVQNNILAHPRALVSVAVNGYYNDDEVAAAKGILYSDLESLKLDGLPRLKKRLGENKRKADCEDILDFFLFADGAKCQLSTYVAANLKRVLTVAPGDVDIFAMATSLAMLTSHVDSLMRKMDDMTTHNEITARRMDAYDNLLKQGTCGNNTTASVQVNQADDPHALTWANRISVSSSEAVVQPSRKPSITVRVKGKATLSNRVKAVPRNPLPKLLKAFVGRMHPDTKEEDLTGFLSDAGLTVIHCRKLAPPAGKQFSTAAFYVACVDSDASQILFYNDSIWPEGAELRDWYTKQ
jgi:hypothetical protein